MPKAITAMTIKSFTDAYATRATRKRHAHNRKVFFMRCYLKEKRRRISFLLEWCHLTSVGKEPSQTKRLRIRATVRATISPLASLRRRSANQHHCSYYPNSAQ